MLSSWEQEGYSGSYSVAQDNSTGYAGLIPGYPTGATGYHVLLKNGWPSQFFTPPPFISPSLGVGQGFPSYGAYPGIITCRTFRTTR